MDKRYKFGTLVQKMTTKEMRRHEKLTQKKNSLVRYNLVKNLSSNGKQRLQQEGLLPLDEV